jgi:type II secretory pathway pseudopilin PulG
MRNTSQSGALFGLDARIALAIFSILSVVAGVAVVMNIDSTRAQVLATELADTGKALEAYHNDVKTDIFLSLSTPSGKNAFQALYDNAVVSDSQGDGPNLRARWNGPYIKFTTNRNARYGEMYLTKAGPDHAMPCNPEELCYVYLVYSSVKDGITTDANKVLDGENEKKPEREGRLQWSSGDQPGYTALYYRAHRALSQSMDY